MLLFDMHHIIGDGTSMGILISDMAQFYQDEELLPLRVQYKDFSVWQNNLFESGRIKKQEEYWLDLFGNEIPKLNFPTDFPRPGVQNFAGNRYEFILDKEETKKLSKISFENNSTLYMNLLSALNILLLKYTGQTDIIIGTAIAGRHHSDLTNIIGMFVNTLAMRNFPKGNKSYTEFLKEVNNNSIAAFENQDVQFEDLVDKLNLERDPSRNPLFDI